MIKVNETCIGCGACTAIAPENFEFDDNGLSKVISETVTDNTRAAAGACPVGAIEITEAIAEKAEVVGEIVPEEDTNDDMPMAA